MCKTAARKDSREGCPFFGRFVKRPYMVRKNLSF